MRRNAFFAGSAILALGFILSLCPVQADEKPIGQITKWEGLPGAAQLRLSDLDRDGQAEAISLVDGSCRIYGAGGGNSYELIASISLEGKRFTAIATADLDGDGTIELLLGTDDLGFIAVYGWDNGPVFHTMSKHTWKAVSNLLAADVDGDGRKDVFAVTPDGDITLFRYTGASLDPLWRGSKALPDLREFFAFRSVGQMSEWFLAVDRMRGSLTAYSWQKGVLSRQWENFPWGGALASAIGDLDGDGFVEILAVSGRKLLYSFTATKTGIVSKWKPVELPTLCTFLLHPLHVPGMFGIVSTAGQLLVYRSGNDGPVLAFKSEPMSRPAWTGLIRENEPAFMLSSGDLVSLTLTEPVPRIRIWSAGRLKDWNPSPKLFNEHVYFPVSSLQSAVQIKVHLDSQSGKGVLDWGTGQYTFATDSREITAPDGTPVTLLHAPVRHEKDVWLPLELLDAISPGRLIWNPGRFIVTVNMVSAP